MAKRTDPKRSTQANTSMYIPIPLKNKVKEHAASEHRSMSQQVAYYLDRGLKADGVQ